MSDFDDDDFGNFEGADETTQVPVVPEQQNVLSWIIQNSPKTTDDKLAAELGKAADSQQTEQKDDVANSQPVQNFFADGFLGMAKNIKNEKIEEVEKTDTKFVQTQENERKLAELEAAKNLEIEDLKTKLSNMILRKEQSEKGYQESIEELKNEMIAKEENHNAALQKFGADIAKLKQEHKSNISTLQELSDKTVEVISQQNNELWEKFEENVKIKSSEDANKIVEHCIELMEKQNGLLKQTIKDHSAEAKSELQEVMKEERIKFETDVKEQVKNEHEIVKKEMETYLKEHIITEMSSIRNNHEKLLKESLQEQQETFKIQLQESLKEENEKFNKVLNETVETTIKKVTAQITEQEKQNNENLKRKSLAAKMFLTSAMQQIDNLFNEVNEND